MEDIELVIKIPEELYEAYKGRPPMLGDVGMDMIAQAIANGTPLPKGHGELKDADAMINKLCTHEASELFGSTTCAEIMDFINGEKPIIEADKEDSGEIKVGDKVKYRPSFTKEDAFGVVTGIDNDHHYAYIMDANGDFCTVIFADLIKTGESYPEIPEVLKRMRGNMKANNAPQKYNYLRSIGYSSHDDESWYECPVCKRQYRSWNLFREGINSGDVFQCECGEKLLYK